MGTRRPNTRCSVAFYLGAAHGVDATSSNGPSTRDDAETIFELDED